MDIERDLRRHAAKATAADAAAKRERDALHRLIREAVAAGMSQIRVAELVGCHREYVRLIVKGKR